MPTTTIDFVSRTERTARPHRVYLKTNWSDEWTRIPWLFAEEVAWRLAPSLSTANLAWRYGVGIRQGEVGVQLIQRLTNVRRAYCKIEVDGFAVTSEENPASPDPARWYGTIELDGAANEGLTLTHYNNGQAVYGLSGLQPLIALGLEHALYRTPIKGSAWLDIDGGVKRSDRPFVFNEPDSVGVPQGNRSNGLVAGSYLFAPDVAGDAASLWTSRTITDYLCSHERPKNAAGLSAFPIILDPESDTVLPEWDRPIIDPTGMTVGELLNLLMPRSRMLSWYLRVDESLLTTFLTPISMLGSDVPTDLGTLKGAVRKININDSTAADLSPDTQYSIKDSDFAVIDQARVRGAPRTSTCTLRRSSAVTIDRSIGPGWPTSLETEYEAGYSAAGTYATLGTDGKQSANAEVRHTDRLFPVFRRYAIPEFWDQKVTQEDGGTRYPVFLANDLNSLSARRICPREIELAPTLPFKEGFNYESLGSLSLPTAPVRISDGPHNRRAAFVLFKTPSWSSPGSAPYIQAEKIGVGAAVEQVNVNRPRHWTARVEIPHKDRAILLHVTGEPQHAIAFDDFTRLPVDEYLGRWSWRDALFTVCIYDEKYSEGVYPSDLEASFHVAGYKRELVIDAGDQYKLDYVVPGTVIGIDQTTRQPVRCTAGGWANDDRKILNARARQIYEYYGQTRRSLRLSTPIVNSQIGLGDYVVNFGSEHSVRSLGTTVSEVIVTIPSGTGANVPPPMIHYTTAFAELETIELLNRRPDPRELRGRAAALDAVRP